MTSIGAANGPRGSSLKLRPPEGMLWLSQRSLRLPALSAEGCGESPVRLVLASADVAAATGLPCARRAEALLVGAIIHGTQRQIKCHTMPSNFTRKSLKTNDGHPNEVSHFFEGRISRTRAVFRFSIFDFRFSSPLPESHIAAIPGFLATSHSSLATSLPGGII
jgi:hypothetical protein